MSERLHRWWLELTDWPGWKDELKVIALGVPFAALLVAAFMLVYWLGWQIFVVLVHQAMQS